MLIIFLLFFAFMFFYLGYNFFKRKNSDIIEIEDIQMIVINKNRHTDKDGRTDYSVRLEGVNDAYKKTNLSGKTNYLRYNKGDVVKMQEVVYKYKDEVFSDIIFAKDEHYSRLEKFKLSANDDIFSESEIDSQLYDYNKCREPKENTIIVSVFVIFFILIAGFMLNERKFMMDELGYTRTTKFKIAPFGITLFEKEFEEYVEPSEDSVFGQLASIHNSRFTGSDDDGFTID